MSIKIMTLTFSTIALVVCSASSFAQTFHAPNVQTAPVIQTAPIQHYPVQQFPIDNGQIIPAAATLPAGEVVPSAQTISPYPNQPPSANTMAPAPAIQVPWTQELVKDVQTAHDFGSVPTGSQQEHTFEFVNTTDATLNLVSVKASCGCTKPTVLTALVQPGETAKVKAEFETLKFRGEKAATVTVGVNKLGTFSEYGEMQFSVKGKIRKDVVLTPGNISFHNVLANSDSQQTVKMKYAGNPLWKILRVESTNPNINAEARELKREGGRITYELVVKLNGSQPAGAFADELFVITNDKHVNKMPITVAGRVKPTLEAGHIKLGVIQQGDKIEKRFVIRGQRPFEVQEVRVGNELISFAPSSGEKSLHVLTYTLDTSEPCEIHDKIMLVAAFADSPDEPQQKSVDFSVRIVPPAITAP